MSPSPVLACFRMSEKGGKKVPFFTLVPCRPESSKCHPERSRRVSGGEDGRGQVTCGRFFAALKNDRTVCWTFSLSP